MLYVVKDTLVVLNVPRYHGNHHSVCPNGLKKRLAEKTNTCRGRTACKHQGIVADTHGAGLEPVTIVTDRIYLPDCNLLAVAKTATCSWSFFLFIKRRYIVCNSQV